MKRWLLIFLMLLLPAVGFADKRKPRTQQTVKKEQQENSRQIKQTKDRIRENRRKVEHQLNQLNSLNGEIAYRENQIRQITDEIADIDRRMVVIIDSIHTLETNIELLRRSLGKSMREARSRRQAMTEMSLIFSSRTVSDAMRRLSYIRQLDKWRTSKVATLRYSIELLDLKRQGLEDMRHRHAALVDQLAKERDALLAKQQSAGKLVNKLRREGSDLQAVLKDRERRAAALNAELEKIIAEEARRAEEERQRQLAEERRLAEEAERRRRADSAATSPATTPEPKKDTTPQQPKKSYSQTADDDRRLTGSFESNKGRLLFPVAGKYNIVAKFGRTQHANLQRVEVENAGIDIEAQPGTTARSVFEGVVSSIFYMDGYHNIVMVRHGQYLTVYANIDRLDVKKGDTVTAGQSLGRIYSDADDDNRTVLHFEVRKEKEKLDPQQWVK